MNNKSLILKIVCLLLITIISSFNASCTTLGPIPDVPMCGYLPLTGGEACTTTITKKRIRYNKADFEKLQNSLPIEDRYYYKFSIRGWTKIKTWILQACTKDNMCRETLLNDELNYFEKGVGLSSLKDQSSMP